MNFILDQLARPMIHRLGTAAGAYLATAEIVNGTQAASIESALILLGGVALDLITRKVI